MLRWVHNHLQRVSLQWKGIRVCRICFLRSSLIRDCLLAAQSFTKDFTSGKKIRVSLQWKSGFSLHVCLPVLSMCDWFTLPHDRILRTYASQVKAELEWHQISGLLYRIISTAFNLKSCFFQTVVDGGLVPTTRTRVTMWANEWCCFSERESRTLGFHYGWKSAVPFQVSCETLPLRSRKIHWDCRSIPFCTFKVHSRSSNTWN